jgi:ADP-dependent NAD(P)H-hydrate dehydratase / NAD(P)H-hydrate epimerase
VIQRVSADAGPWWLFDTAQSRGIEARALARHEPGALMERAGIAVARLASAVAPHAAQVTVLAGPGNNGGDGLVAAMELHRAGRSVQVHLVASPARRPADAEAALHRAHALGVPISPGLPVTPLGASDLVIDALLGLGAARPLEGEMAAAVTWADRQSATCLAVDLPSGLQADTGQPSGPVVRADHTLCLLTLKPGVFTAGGRDQAGQVWLDTLGITIDEHERAAAVVRVPAMAELRQPWAARPHASHKGSFGDVAVVGGDVGMTGAAWLGAQAALAAGAGRVYYCPLDDSASLLLPQHPELMGRHRWWLSPRAVLETTTVVCGCGGGTAVAAALPPLLSHVERLVLDADALNAVAADPSLARLVKNRAGRGLATVMTPHPLEAARLLGCTAAKVQADRLASARELSAAWGCVVVLKGSGTVVARPSGPAAINLTGNALLATAGTGDVLAGWIGGTWGLPSLRSDDAAWAAALSSVWLHGQAADLAARAEPHAPTLRASALIEAMRAAVSA